MTGAGVGADNRRQRPLPYPTQPMNNISRSRRFSFDDNVSRVTESNVRDHLMFNPFDDDVSRSTDAGVGADNRAHLSIITIIPFSIMT